MKKESADHRKNRSRKKQIVSAALSLFMAAGSLFYPSGSVMACPRNVEDSTVSGIDLSLNHLPGPMRLLKSKFAGAAERSQAAAEAAGLASNWQEAYESYRGEGEPNYIAGQVAQSHSDSEARFEVSVSAHYLCRYLSYLYQSCATYEEAIHTKLYYLYLQAAKCFISMNHVCFDGVLTSDYRSVYDSQRSDDSAHKVYESYYSADYKRLDNLHGPHSTPILWFDDDSTEPSARSGAGRISGAYTEDYGTDFDTIPVYGEEIATASVEDFVERLSQYSLDALPEAMKFTPASKNLYKVYLDISDNLKSQHSNFENYQHWGTFLEYDVNDASYEQLLEAATQVFQFMYVIAKESKDASSFTSHKKYPLYEQACKCFLSINERCFANSFGNEDLSFSTYGVTANVFTMDVESVIAVVPLANPNNIGSSLYLDDYTCLYEGIAPAKKEGKIVTNADETREAAEEYQTMDEETLAYYQKMIKEREAMEAEYRNQNTKANAAQQQMETSSDDVSSTDENRSEEESEPSDGKKKSTVEKTKEEEQDEKQDEAREVDTENQEPSYPWLSDRVIEQEGTFWKLPKKMGKVWNPLYFFEVTE